MPKHGHQGVHYVLVTMSPDTIDLLYGTRNVTPGTSACQPHSVSVLITVTKSPQRPSTRVPWQKKRDKPHCWVISRNTSNSTPYAATFFTSTKELSTINQAANWAYNRDQWFMSSTGHCAKLSGSQLHSWCSAVFAVDFGAGIHSHVRAVQANRATRMGCNTLTPL